MSTSPPSPFPNVRRVVTGHSPSGTAVFLDDHTVKPRPIENGALFTDLFRTEEFPVSNSVKFSDKIKDTPEELVSKGGSTFRVVDMPPGCVTVCATMVYKQTNPLMTDPYKALS